MLSILPFSLATAMRSGLWLIAQTGGGKTAIGWLIVLLCIALGLLVVCRPSGRKETGGKKK